MRLHSARLHLALGREGKEERGVIYKYRYVGGTMELGEGAEGWVLPGVHTPFSHKCIRCTPGFLSATQKYFFSGNKRDTLAEPSKGARICGFLHALGEKLIPSRRGTGIKTEN